MCHQRYVQHRAYHHYQITTTYRSLWFRYRSDTGLNITSLTRVVFAHHGAEFTFISAISWSRSNRRPTDILTPAFTLLCLLYGVLSDFLPLRDSSHGLPHPFHAIPSYHPDRFLPLFPNHHLFANSFRHLRWHAISRRRVCPASALSDLCLYWSRVPRWDSCWRRGTSNCQFRWVGTAWGGPVDAAEHISLANTIAKEVVDFSGKEEGHTEDRRLNLTEFCK